MKPVGIKRIKTREETISKMNEELRDREIKLFEKFVNDRQKLVDKKMAVLEKKLARK